jgi:hypothetical protein
MRTGFVVGESGEAQAEQGEHGRGAVLLAVLRVIVNLARERVCYGSARRPGEGERECGSQD